MDCQHAELTKAVDRGSILLVVYAAFSMGVVDHIWRSVQPWQLVPWRWSAARCWPSC